MYLYRVVAYPFGKRVCDDLISDILFYERGNLSAIQFVFKILNLVPPPPVKCLNDKFLYYSFAIDKFNVRI